MHHNCPVCNTPPNIIPVQYGGCGYFCICSNKECQWTGGEINIEMMCSSAIEQWDRKVENYYEMS